MVQVAKARNARKVAGEHYFDILRRTFGSPYSARITPSGTLRFSLDVPDRMHSYETLAVCHLEGNDVERRHATNSAPTCELDPCRPAEKGKLEAVGNHRAGRAG